MCKRQFVLQKATSQEFPLSPNGGEGWGEGEFWSLFSTIGITQDVVLKPGGHELACPEAMIFTKRGPQSRVNPQKIGVVAIFITRSNLVNPLTHHLDQSMFRMSR